MHTQEQAVRSTRRRAQHSAQVNLFATQVNLCAGEVLCKAYDLLEEQEAEPPPPWSRVEGKS